MDKILVIGDLRSHLVTRREAADEARATETFPMEQTSWTKRINGGAWMMADAIRQILLEQPVLPRLPTGNTHRTALPSDNNAVISYKISNPTQLNRIKWDLKDTTLPGTDNHSPRLVHPSIQPNVAAGTSGTASSVELDGDPTLLHGVPDILVVNDLGHGFRFILDDNRAIADQLSASTHDSIKATLGRYLDLREISDSQQPPHVDFLLKTADKINSICNEADHQRASQICLEIASSLREQATAASITQCSHPILQPLIIVSIDTGQIPSIVEATREEPISQFWSRLHGNSFLKDRVIVVFDAARLRDSHLPISTALSWERTAQDTIATFQSEARLRPFLDFGHLVIRYGVAGALHIRRDNSSWRYELFFSPEFDDASWVDPLKYGHVLGNSSIVVASLVRELSRTCHTAGKNALLKEVDSCISTGLRKSLLYCQRLCRRGYPEKTSPPWHLFPFDGIFARMGSVQEIAAQQSISNAEMSPTRSRNWAILKQSSQFNPGEIAHAIVMRGPDAVLNNLPLPIDDVVELCAEDFRRNAYDLAGSVSTGLWDMTKLCKEMDGVVTSIVSRLIDAKVLTEEEQIATERQLSDDIQNSFSASPLSQIDISTPATLAEHTRIVEESVDSASDIFARGLLRTFGKHTQMAFQVAAPIGRFGKVIPNEGEDSRLLVVDRREIESFRSIRNLIKRHLSKVRSGDADSGSSRPQRPLSIAVFGPPGSGKSWSVRKIVDSIGDVGEVHPFQYNLSQFSGPDDLAVAFRSITDAIAVDKIPIAFFDEFDTQYKSSPLGWLQYFLAPMEDGKFRDSGDKTLQSAILVFAGGSSTSFADFCRKKNDEQWILFSQAKGPDFISRLSGHLEILGVNAVDVDDELYLVRRAVVLRSLLRELQRPGKGVLARIDDDILRAFLCIPKYHHGVRSMRILLELCQTQSGTISQSVLPLIEQLNMHVDGKTFVDLVSNVSVSAGRSRLFR